MNLLVKNIGQLVTLAPLGQEQRGCKISADDLGIVDDAWMLVKEGKVASYGSMSQLPEFSGEVFDAKSRLVMPGLIDSHTHPIFAGSRHKEFAMRLDGKTYQEIAEQGGGITATVSFTKNASNDTLKSLTKKRFQTFLKKGVTTVEAKSGYGLVPEEELRALQILKEINEEIDQEVVNTCLALHALPKEHNNNTSFIADVNERLLPEVAKQQLARYVDVFIETGYFSVEDAKPYVQLAKELGFGIRIHADEFSDAGAALAAAQWGAASADHLQSASSEGIQAMGKAGVVATILPGTSLYTNIPFTKVQPFFEAGCAVGLATDYNPGSCLVDNLALIATLGALHCGLTTAQAIAAVTYVPAMSLGLQESKGCLTKGFDADFFVFDGSEAAEWLADMGRTEPSDVWIRGEKQKLF